MEIPIEDFEPGDEGKVARLSLSCTEPEMPHRTGMRSTRRFWRSAASRLGLASPCNFEHVNRELKLTVHGDDFTVMGPTADLPWMQRRMERKRRDQDAILWTRMEYEG